VTLLRRIFDEHRRALLPLGIALVVNVAVLLAAVVPLQTIVANSAGQASAAMRNLAEARRAERDAIAAKASKDRAEKELARFYTDVLPTSFDAARKTTNIWMQEAARDAGLQFKGLHFDWEPVRDSRLSRAFSKVTLQGRYPNIRKFLYSLETAKEFIIVERVELAEPSQAANGVLQLSLTISTYYVSKPS
jgi:Tfp pilus assembly protein PilO